MESCHDYEELLSGYLDGELTQQGRQEVELHVDGCSSCRHALDELTRIREEVGGLTESQPTPEQWSRMMSGAVRKTSRGLGWLLGMGGGLVLAGYAAYEFATDEATDALVKVGVAGVLGGLALLLLSVLMERSRAARTDRYKDVEL
jgi:anti-sigma factor RsiW